MAFCRYPSHSLSCLSCLSCLALSWTHELVDRWLSKGKGKASRLPRIHTIQRLCLLLKDCKTTEYHTTWIRREIVSSCVVNCSCHKQYWWMTWGNGNSKQPTNQCLVTKNYFPYQNSVISDISNHESILAVATINQQSINCTRCLTCSMANDMIGVHSSFTERRLETLKMWPKNWDALLKDFISWQGCVRWMRLILYVISSPNPVKIYLFECITQQGLSKYTFVIFALSTTGQGEFPKNARRFWNSLLRKRLPPNCLSHVNFTTFGLGDSSYAK